MKIRKFIGFYDKNGKKLYEGDLVTAPRYFMASRHSSGRKPKNIPDKITHIYKIKWSNISPQYIFLDKGPINEHKELSKNYPYDFLSHFESKPKSMFWKQKDGTIANSWHWDDIKHIKGEKKYKCLYDIELIKRNK